MIQDLHLKNCQSHKDTFLEFHSGVNVLVGDTDSGKSAIIRSLEKVIWNNFTSKELTSHWGGPLNIKVTVDNNTIILNNDKKDSYKLNKTIFKAINGKVPKEISDIINMDSINIQSQIDSFFLLNETSGYVASYLNQIANLSQIDSTTKSIKSELNETKRTIEHDKTNLAEKEKELDAYNFLPNLKKEIKNIADLEAIRLDAEFEKQTIDSLIIKLEDIDSKLQSNKKLLILKPKINKALELINKIEDLKLAEEDLNSNINKLESLEFELNKLKKLINLKSKINSTIKDKEKKSILNTKLNALNALINKLSTLDEKIKIAILKRESEHSIYHSELSKLDKCFFCGSKLN